MSAGAGVVEGEGEDGGEANASASAACLRTWLELEDDGFCHAGEYLRAVLHVVSDGSQSLLVLATVQLSGEATTEDRLVNAASLEQLNRLPRYAATAGNAHGGGRFFDETSRKGRANGRGKAGRTLPVFSAPPAILAVNEHLEPSQQYSYEWVMPLGPDALPSYAGRAVAVRYYLTVGLRLRSGDVVYERECRVLPAFCSEQAQNPFRRYNFKETISCISDPSFTRRLCPEEGAAVPTVWQRYRDGIVPRMEDFARFPLALPHHRSEAGESATPSHASLFDNLAMQPSGATFSLQGREGVVAQAKISKTLLRLGEEVCCLLQFVDGAVSVFQLRATLEYREEVGAEYEREGGRPSRHILRQYETACWMHEQLSFSLSLPSDANGTFHSDLVTSTWVLSLLLVCGTNRDAGGASLLGATPVDGEKSVVACDFPLRVVPSLAVHLSTSRAADPRSHATGPVVVALHAK